MEDFVVICKPQEGIAPRRSKEEADGSLRL